MEFNKKNTKTAVLLIILFVALMTVAQNLSIFVGAIKYIYSLFTTILAGLCIAFILNVIMRGFENTIFKPLAHSKSKFARRIVRPMSLILTLVVVFGVISVALLVVVPDLRSTIATIGAALPDFFNSVVNKFYELLGNFNIDLNNLPQIDIDWESLVQTITKYVSQGSTIIIISAANITTTVISTLANLVISFVIAIYTLLQKEKVALFWKRFINAFLPKKVSETVLMVTRLANELFSNFVTGQLTEAVILGSLCFLGMVIFRFPFATVISVLMGVTALIPIVGAFIGLAIGAFLILIESPIKALLFIIFILCLQQFEGSVIYPKVVGKSIGIPGILVFIAVVIGGNIGGIMGILIGVPLTALIYTLVSEYILIIEERRARENSSTSISKD